MILPIGDDVPMRWLSVPVLFVATLAAQPAVAADFTIEEWRLTAAALGTFPDRSIQNFLEVSDPFADSHVATIGLTSAEVIYDIWPSLGQFIIDGDLQIDAEMDTSRQVGMDGEVVFTATRPLHVEYSLVFDITLPAVPMSASLQFFAFDRTADEELADMTRGHNALSGLGSRHLEVGGAFDVEAGRIWSMSYLIYLAANSGSSGHLGLGDAHIEMTITPEPATAVLLVAAVIPLTRRRRVRR